MKNGKMGPLERGPFCIFRMDVKLEQKSIDKMELQKNTLA